MDKSKNKICVTRNYSKFKRLDGNRGVNLARVQKIMKSIKSVGYISQPIIVNDRFEIIDGQGRLEALKRLGMPVEYIVESGKGIDECVYMNATSTNWSLRDYIDSYAERGNESYVRLHDLMDSYNVNLSVICTALFNTLKFHIDTIKSGTLNISMDLANSASIRLSEMLSILSYLNSPDNKSKTFLQQALLIVLSFDEVDHVRFKNAVIKHLQVPSNNTWKNVDEVVRAFEDAYNYGAHKHKVVMIYNIYRELIRINGLRGAYKLSNQSVDLTKNS